MNFYKNLYSVYVILGKSLGAPLFYWETWKSVFPLLSPVIEVARGGTNSASIRTSQLNSVTHKGIQFGRSGWNEKNHLQWTLGSPMNPPSESSFRRFLKTEIWAPHWDLCEREDAAPDVFLSVNSHGVPAFDQSLILAVQKNLTSMASLATLTSTVCTIAPIMNAVMVAVKHEVAWGIATAIGDGFSDSIQDFNMGFSSVIRRSGGYLDPSFFPRGNWTLLNCDEEAGED